MLRFTLINDKVVLDPNIILIQEFKNILDYYKAKKKPEAAFDMLLFVFYCCDLTEANFLRDTDHRLKKSQAARRVYNKDEKELNFSAEEQQLLDSAIDAYNFFNETALERATLAFDKKIDEIRSLMDEITPNSTSLEDADGQIIKYVSNAGDIEKFSKLLSDLAVYKLKSLETAKKIENTGRVRGNKGSSLIERGAFLKKVAE